VKCIIYDLLLYCNLPVAVVTTQPVLRLDTGWAVRGSNPGGSEIFRNHPDRLRGPPGLLYCGYRGSFTKWFDHFAHFIKPSADDPVLLIVDGHYSHTKNLDVVGKVRDHSVAIVSLPPHSKHKMQPLDAGFMKSLKRIMHKKLKSC